MQQQDTPPLSYFRYPVWSWVGHRDSPTATRGAGGTVPCAHAARRTAPRNASSPEALRKIQANKSKSMACSCSRQGPRRFGRVTQIVVSTLVSRIVCGVRVVYTRTTPYAPQSPRTPDGPPRPTLVTCLVRRTMLSHLRSTVKTLLHCTRHLGSRKLSSNRRSAKPERTLGRYWVGIGRQVGSEQ